MSESAADAVQPQAICYRALELVREQQFVDAEKLLHHWLNKTTDPVPRGLFHSAFGVLEKCRGHFKEALRHYERAEKLLPSDPVLKLITAQLLIDVFKETDRAIRKCRQVEKLLPENPVVVHHARTLEGLAHAVSGNRRQAVAQLARSLEGDFAGFLTCDNINFLLVERCVGKAWEPVLCRRFVMTALECARRHQEAAWTERLHNILHAMDTSAPAAHTPSS